MLGGVDGPCPDDMDEEREEAGETGDGVDAADMVTEDEQGGTPV